MNLPSSVYDQLIGCPLRASASSNVPLSRILPPVLIISAFLAVVAFYVWRRMRSRNMDLSEKLLTTEQEMMQTQSALETIRKVWEIDWDQMKLGKVLGQGAFGQVLQAEWRGMSVAVKVLTTGYMESAELKNEMDREATMLQTLRHAHVVLFLGAGVNEEGMPFIVTELMELGSLTSLLHDDNHRLLHPADWATKQRFAMEIASGMALVHSLGRMHRDLKSGNILATMIHGSTVRVKVADFGTATLAGQQQQLQGQQQQQSQQSQQLHQQSHQLHHTMKHTKGVGTPLWMAPELLAGRKYNQSADVYSYAILLWEMASHKYPWEELKGAFISQQVSTRVEAGERPDVNRNEWPATYVGLMEQCWAGNPSVRPAFREIAERLQTI